jgi:hypothetical protein
LGHDDVGWHGLFSPRCETLGTARFEPDNELRKSRTH